MAGESIDLATVMAAVATLMTLACGWPQLRRISRTGDIRGVSLSTTALGISAELGWLIYLSGERLWSALPECALTILVDAVLAAALLRSGARRRTALVAATAWGATLVGARIIGGPAAIAVLLSITYAVQLFPSVWTAWRERCPSGVASGAWVMRLAESALWAAYGHVRHDPPLVTLGVIGCVASASVLARLVVTRAQREMARPSAIGADCESVAPEMAVAVAAAA